MSSEEDLIRKYEKVVEVAASIAGIDHDINNQLTVFSLLQRRLQKAGEEYNDEKLLKSSQQIAEATENIKNILSRLQDLKKLELIKEKRGQIRIKK
jgi:signal transduction histidine kinase